MAKVTRQIIKIDEEKCNGCGLCVPSCAEGALQIVDGKAKLVQERYCDGLGACLGDCPQGAISFETREAEDFDEAATIEHLKDTGRSVQAHLDHMAEHAAGGHDHHAHAGHSHGHGGGFVCPSAKTIDRREQVSAKPTAQGQVQSELRQWPVKLYLVNPNASYFEGADLLISADCVPFAYGAMHPDFLRGKTLVTGCPKFDDVQTYADKLAQIVSLNDIRSITVLQMEVPCCSGMARLAEHAVASSGKQIPVEVVTMSLDGAVKGSGCAAGCCH